MKIPYIILALAVLLSFSAFADPVPYQSSVRIPDIERTDAQEREAMLKVTKISQAQAQTAAKKAVPHGKLIKTELENEDGNVVYEVEFLDNGVERTVIVDAGNGKILSNTVDDD